MDNIDYLKNKFKDYRKEDIIFTSHANIQAFIRQIDLEEVKNNISNPIKLVFVRKQISNNPNHEKFDCYFAYNKILYHRYIIDINAKIIIVTLIKINRDWQKSIG